MYKRKPKAEPRALAKAEPLPSISKPIVAGPPEFERSLLRPDAAEVVRRNQLVAAIPRLELGVFLIRSWTDWVEAYARYISLVIEAGLAPNDQEYWAGLIRLRDICVVFDDRLGRLPDNAPPKLDFFVKGLSVLRSEVLKVIPADVVEKALIIEFCALSSQSQDFIDSLEPRLRHTYLNNFK